MIPEEWASFLTLAGTLAGGIGGVLGAIAAAWSAKTARSAVDDAGKAEQARLRHAVTVAAGRAMAESKAVERLAARYRKAYEAIASAKGHARGGALIRFSTELESILSSVSINSDNAAKIERSIPLRGFDVFSAQDALSRIEVNIISIEMEGREIERRLSAIESDRRQHEAGLEQARIRNVLERQVSSRSAEDN